MSPHDHRLPLVDISVPGVRSNHLARRRVTRYPYVSTSIRTVSWSGMARSKAARLPDQVWGRSTGLMPTVVAGLQRRGKDSGGSDRSKTRK